MAKVSLNTILLGVGAIYSPYNLDPLKTLGLDLQKASKLAMMLCAHSVQYVNKLASTSAKTYVTDLRSGMEHCSSPS